MAKILLVEDDINYAKTLKTILLSGEYTVDQAFDGQAALQFLEQYRYDLIVLDWQLPLIDGSAVCKKFRQSGGMTPILMLTAKSQIEDKEQGLDAGADDYLSKPAHPRELLARIRALLRRPSEIKSKILKFRNIELDPTLHTLTLGGEQIELRPREFALLEFLMKHPRQLFSADELVCSVWPASADTSPEAVRVCISRLRTKLDTPGQESIFKNIYSVGYGLADE